MNDNFKVKVTITGDENLDLIDRVHPPSQSGDVLHVDYKFPRAHFWREGYADAMPIMFDALKRADTKVTLSDPVEDMHRSEKELGRALDEFRKMREALQAHETLVWRTQTFKLIDMIAGAWAKKKGIVTPYATFDDCVRMLEDLCEEPHFVHEGI